MSYLTGEESEKALSYLLEDDRYQQDNEADQKLFGLHLEGDTWIAWDNRGGECNVEEFKTEKRALKWLEP